MGRHRRSRTPKQRIRRGRFRRGGGVPHDGGRAARHVADAGSRTVGPARQTRTRRRPTADRPPRHASGARRRRMGVAPPSKTDKGDVPANRMTVSGVARSPARVPSHGTGTRYASRWPTTPTGVACSPNTASSPTRAKRRSRRARNPRRRCRTTASPTTWTGACGNCSTLTTSMRAMTGSRHRAPCAGC